MERTLFVLVGFFERVLKLTSLKELVTWILFFSNFGTERTSPEDTPSTKCQFEPKSSMMAEKTSRTHMPAVPSGFITLRIFQLIVAITTFGVSIWLLMHWGSLGSILSMTAVRILCDSAYVNVFGS